ncbi:MAG: exodeoxyribonuclease VII small subunit [Bacteroidetes bacterium]|nr:exodeoxyribonuclease VII small subunit [Bacteroidota bacterium]
MSKKKIKNNFEENLSRLEEISNLLESKEIGLDDAILLFEEGIKLSKTCITNLKKAELKISKLKSELSDIALDEDDEFIED